MKKHLEMIFGTIRSTLLATLTVALIFGPTASMAALNTATWDIAGAGQAPSAINLYSYSAGSITLTKVAFLTDGTALADGATVPTGTQVQFMIYVQNANAFTMNDISISDDLSVGGFTYDAAVGLKVDNSQLNTAAVADIYTAVNGVAVSNATDAVDGDVAANPTGTLVTAGSTALNAPLNVPATSTWAILFTVTMP